MLISSSYAVCLVLILRVFISAGEVRRFCRVRNLVYPAMCGYATTLPHIFSGMLTFVSHYARLSSLAMLSY